MNRKPLLACTIIGMSLGSCIPIYMGVDDGFGGWSILGGLVGGFVGLWLGVVIAKRY